MRSIAARVGTLVLFSLLLASSSEATPRYKIINGGKTAVLQERSGQIREIHYNDQRWMQPEDQRHFVRAYLDTYGKGLPLAHPKTVKHLQETYPILRGLRPRDFRIVMAEDDRVHDFMFNLGKELAPVGFQVEQSSGHPYFFIKRDQREPEPHPFTFIHDASVGKFPSTGTATRSQRWDKPSRSKEQLMVGWLGPETLKKEGGEIQEFVDSRKDWDGWNGWEGKTYNTKQDCATFATACTRWGRLKYTEDPLAPFKNVTGYRPAYAPLDPNNEKGSHHILKTATQGPAFVLLRLPKAEYEKWMTKARKVHGQIVMPAWEIDMTRQ